LAMPASKTDYNAFRSKIKGRPTGRPICVENLFDLTIPIHPRLDDLEAVFPEGFFADVDTKSHCQVSRLGLTGAGKQVHVILHERWAAFLVNGI